MKYIAFMPVILVSSVSFAGANLQLLENHLWKGACRKTTNEAGKEVHVGAFQSLQSAYTFKAGNLEWTVASFTDEKCASIHDANRGTYKCETKPATATCKSVLSEKSTDGKAWTKQPLTDSDPMLVSVKSRGKNKVDITATGESEDADTETLTR